MTSPHQDPATIHTLVRRTFLRGATAALATLPAAAGAAGAAGATAATPTPGAGQEGIDPRDLEAGVGAWLGRRFWGNRLQDWVNRGGRLECVADPGMRTGRTVAVLTTELRSAPFTLAVRTGTLEAGAGFSGFVIGTGVPDEDARRRALVCAASGTGGGIIAAYESDGRVSFREHTDEINQLAYAVLATSPAPAPRPRSTREDVTLRLQCRAAGSAVRLTLTATDTASGIVLASVTLSGVDPQRVRGGVSLMSSAARVGSPARYWLSGYSAFESGQAPMPQRELGPVMGTLFSVSAGVLKMTVQMMPVDPRQVATVDLEFQRAGVWERYASAPIGPGYTATFRRAGLDLSTPQGYRVRVGAVTFGGTIPATPRNGRLTAASVNCTKASHRPVDRPSNWSARLPGSKPLDLYSERNIYFPHDKLVASISATQPDLLVAQGDQLYETSPTAKDTGRSPELDWLYKYLLWLWSFRSLTRRMPTIVLVDDHDQYQPNLWGEGGIDADGRPEAGGFVNAPEWVNLVRRTSCGHNPDPFDPRPIAQGISVSYGAFSYGGVSFAMIEDRTFKTGADGVDSSGAPIPVDRLALLGERQELFLQEWRSMHPGQPKVILTGTTWACVQTDVDGGPTADRDSNGWPAVGRSRAVRLAGDAHALILAGDQHLGSLVRHGLTSFTDGPVQFTPPAASTSFQRFFHPSPSLPNPSTTPFTGDWTDGFGNRCRVLAVVNPKYTLREFWTYFPAPMQDFGDRGLKREGFGVVAFDHAAQRVTLQCWPWWSASVPGAKQFLGWPVAFTYSSL